MRRRWEYYKLDQIINVEIKLCKENNKKQNSWKWGKQFEGKIKATPWEVPSPL